jgi:RHH-type proline utilization regulon transcriptional repressor/proline dehydrogenase/delta 1-pyrroline-5-carboxylate dehydrogenase
VKRVIAEMGGKNAIIVDRDADLDDAVRGVAASAFGYAGQKCSACSRVIVVGDIHDAFVARLVEASRSLRVGPAENSGTFVGPVVDEAAYRRILKAIDTAKALQTVALETDARHLSGGGYFIGPTIVTDVMPERVLGQEEIFGPVLAVIRARDFDQAIEIANGTRFALTGGVYSRSPRHLEQARRDFKVGNLYLNRRITGAIVGRQPFGGIGMSGVGSKAGGPDYLLQFVEPRVVTENTIRRGFAPGETGSG